MNSPALFLTCLPQHTICSLRSSSSRSPFQLALSVTQESALMNAVGDVVHDMKSNSITALVRGLFLMAAMSIIAAILLLHSSESSAQTNLQQTHFSNAVAAFQSNWIVASRSTNSKTVIHWRTPGAPPVPVAVQSSTFSLPDEPKYLDPNARWRHIKRGGPFHLIDMRSPTTSEPPPPFQP